MNFRIRFNRFNLERKTETTKYTEHTKDQLVRRNAAFLPKMKNPSFTIHSMFVCFVNFVVPLPNYGFNHASASGAADSFHRSP
jgi:hypothetical protein